MLYHKIQCLKLRTADLPGYLKKHGPALAFRVRRSERNVVAIWKCEDVVQIQSVFLSRSCSHCCVWQRMSRDEFGLRGSRDQNRVRVYVTVAFRSASLSAVAAYPTCVYVSSWLRLLVQSVTCVIFFQPPFSWRSERPFFSTEA
jgi:hypothetical protein